MATRKQAPQSETPPPESGVSAGEPSPEPAPSEPAPAAAPAEPVPPAEPVRKYQIERPAPYRAGGHVLTERGWELDTGQEA